MQDTTITSRQNPRVQNARRLLQPRYRRSTGLVLVEGTRSIKDALGAGARIRELFVDSSRCSDPDVSGIISAVGAETHVSLCSSSVIDSISTVEASQGVVAVFDAPELSLDALFQAVDSDCSSMVLIADRIQDPGNLGTLIRLASGAGATGVIMTSGTVDPLNEKVVRSSTSALFRVRMAKVESLAGAVAALKARGVRLVAADVGGASDYFDEDFTGRFALVVGNEGSGISDDDLKLMDSVVAIPMPGGHESLNAAVAASVIVYEAVRQRLRR